MTEEARGPGKPKIKLDGEQIIRLSELQCTVGEIAYVMGVSTDTIRRRFRDEMDLGKAQGKIKLRRAMFRNACEKDHASVQIFLAKNLLGMSDSPVNTEDDIILPWDNAQDTTKDTDDGNISPPDDHPDL